MGSSSLCMAHYAQSGRDSQHFGKINNIISETVQDRDTVTIEK